MPDLGVEAMAHDNHAHLHNDLLNFGSGAGIIGIIAYLILMAAPIVSAIRSPRTVNWPIRITAAAGLVACYVAMGLVDTMFVFEIPKSMFVLCSAVVMAFFLDAPPERRPVAALLPHPGLPGH
jgi:O-antigen ligase